MRFINYFIALFLGVIFFASCERMEPQIVESDYKYTPAEPKGEDRDEIATPPVDMLKQYVYFKDNDHERTLLVFNNGTTKDAQALEDVTVTVSTAVPVKEAFTAELCIIDEKDYPKTYTQIVMEGAQFLPQDMYKLEQSTIEFKVGEQEKKLSLSFNSDKMVDLDDEITYVVPLVIKVPEGKEINLHNFFLVTINKKELQPVEEGDNVELLSGTPSGVTPLPAAALTLDSNILRDRIHGLKDENVWESQWWSRSSEDYITIMFDYASVGGLKIHGLYRKVINTVKVFVTIDGVNWISQGEVTNTDQRSTLNIQFKNPIYIKGIKITGMTPFPGADEFIDIAELEVWEAKM